MKQLTKESDASQSATPIARKLRVPLEEMGDAGHIKQNNWHMFSPGGAHYTPQRELARAVVESSMDCLVLRSAEFDPIEGWPPFEVQLGYTKAIRNVANVKEKIENGVVVGYEYDTFSGRDQVIFYDGCVHLSVNGKKYGSTASEARIRCSRARVIIDPCSILMTFDLNRKNKTYSLLSAALGREVDTQLVKHCFAWLEFSGFKPCSYQLVGDKDRGYVEAIM